MPQILGTFKADPNLSGAGGDPSSIYGFSGNDNITGSSWYDFIDGGSQNWRAIDDIGGYVIEGDDDVINSGDGGDVIYAGPGSDEINGGNGIDAVIFFTSANFMVETTTNHFGSVLLNMRGLIVDLGTGTYNAEYRYKGKLVDVAFGTLQGIEAVTGTGGDDIIRGSLFDDYFRPMAGNDTVDGGAGYDILRYDKVEQAPQKHGITVDFDILKVTDTDGDVDEFSGIEHVIGSKFRDVFIGSRGAQVFTGGDGRDDFLGDAGKDAINYTFELGGKGVDVDMLSGDAIDTYGKLDFFKDIEIIKGSIWGDKILGGRGSDQLYGRQGDDTIDGTYGNDTIFGDDFDDAIGSNDSLKGNLGKDKIFGFAGDDRIDGGTENDTLDGGDGLDTWVAGDRNQSLKIDLLAERMIYTAFKEKDVLRNFENVESGSGDDRIVGDDAANRLSGRDGDDTIIGGRGLDTIEGGKGIDTVDYLTSPFAVTADLDTWEVTFAGVSGVERAIGIENILGSANNDTFRGSNGRNLLVGDKGDDTMSGLGGGDDLEGGEGNDSLDGSGGNDFLGGGSGADFLAGSEGSDGLSGDAGRDTLVGGASRDEFLFSSIKDSLVGESRDVITDFSRAEKDKIVLEGIDADTHTNGNQEFTFIGKAAFSSTATRHVYGEVRFKAGLLQGDVNGDGEADFEIAVTDMQKLVAADLIL